MTTLVIVDMQPMFRSANCDRTTKNVIKAIERAKTVGDNIVILQYERFGPTRSDILDAIGDYPKVMTQWKNRNSGATQVLAAMKNFGDDGLIRVCGVNLGACVYATVWDLRVHYGKTVELIPWACNQPRSWGPKRGAVRTLKANGVLCSTP